MFNPTLIFSGFNESAAIVDQGSVYTYTDLINRINLKRRQLISSFNKPIPVILNGDFSIEAIVWLLALLAENYIVLLVTPSAQLDQELLKHAGVKACITSDDNSINHLESNFTPSSIQSLLLKGDGGVMLLSSGSSGNPKLIVHAASRLLSKYKNSKKSYVTLGFLLFDHIAGFDTLMYTLHAGGTLVTLPNRQVGTVIKYVQNNHVEVLPTTPSFINLLLFETEFSPNYLPDLKIITFGSERMNEITMQRLLDRFNHRVRCEQKYGLTELGSLMLKSKPDDPKWIQLDKRFVSWRVEENILYIKSDSSLIAYIYASDEVLCDGWFNTGDEVLVDGDWIQILGRKTDIINVGGQKVYPTEVESVIQSMEGVLQVVVFGESHPLMGQIVSANIQLQHEEELAAFRSKLRLFCKDKIASYKIPVTIKLSNSPVMTGRFKALRK